MENIDCDSWETFQNSFSSDLVQWDQHKKDKRPIYISTPLFRGQSNSSWKLETTLERFTNRTFDEFDYYQIIRAVRPAIVSLTQKEWSLPEFRKKIVGPVPTGYEFMLYLRHHGFPSPLLDWTRSPYVAAFFAFRFRQVPEPERVAIYSYVDYPEGARAYYAGAPIVHGLGPYVETHKRHYAQQCEYTVCWRETGNERVYASHETAFTTNASDQGALKRYTLPSSERRKVLRQLQLMNVTAFSLFGSEESLIDTLAYQEIESKTET